MKVIAGSDLHLYLPSLPESNLLLLAGDYLMSGMEIEWRKWLLCLEKARNTTQKMIMIFGNHDRYCQKNLPLVKEELKKLDIDLLNDSEIEYKGLRIYGSPWVKDISGIWAWELPAPDCKEHIDKIMNIWSKIPEELDILITHGPPFGILDQSIYRNGNLSPSFGCRYLKARLDCMLRPPKIHIFGHCHSGHGVINTKQTKFYNVSIMDEEYKPHYPITEIEI